MPLDGEDRGDAGTNTVKSSLLFFRNLVIAEEPIEQGCELKKTTGCFPLGIGGVSCPDIDTCPESSK